ncbi:hypothetical protein [Kitasatospora sp. NPDC088783]|uniref:hypothetical protein n=1 Tax=Kitasatospora sp. NPDC088783 TaxID=3364077 RepID=UPI00381682AE
MPVSWRGPVLRLPHRPGGPVAAAPLRWITALTALTAAAGPAGLHRRDLGRPAGCPDRS